MTTISYDTRIELLEELYTSLSHSKKLPSHDNIEAARIEIFDALLESKQKVNELQQMIKSLEQRIQP